MLDPDPEAVDLYILNHLQKGDILITQDNGLAAGAIQKGGLVLSPRGKLYNNAEIHSLLLSRYEGVLAKQGKVKPKSTRSFTKKDRQQFSHALEELLKNQD